MSGRVSWDTHFITRAWLNASMSSCQRRQVGAVAVRDRRSFADGMNGTLAGAVNCDKGGCERCNAPDATSGVGLDVCVCVHAEANVVTYCARTGTPLDGATVYCTTMPCLDCQKLLAAAGVREVVYAQDYPVTTLKDSPLIVRQHDE